MEMLRQRKGNTWKQMKIYDNKRRYMQYNINGILGTSFCQGLPYGNLKLDREEGVEKSLDFKYYNKKSICFGFFDNSIYFQFIYCDRITQNKQSFFKTIRFVLLAKGPIIFEYYY